MSSKCHPLNVPNILQIICLLATLCGVLSQPIQPPHDGLIEGGPRCPASIQRPRLDRLKEGVLSSLEDLTGGCFSMDIRGFRGEHNSAHVAVIRNDHSEFCEGLVVTEVEMIAYGYLDEDDRDIRSPFGTISIERLTEEQLEETCSASDSPNRFPYSFHADYVVEGNDKNVTESVNIFTDCELFDKYIVTIPTTTTTRPTTVPTTTETATMEDVDTAATATTVSGETTPEEMDTEATATTVSGETTPEEMDTEATATTVSGETTPEEMDTEATTEVETSTGTTTEEETTTGATTEEETSTGTTPDDTTIPSNSSTPQKNDTRRRRSANIGESQFQARSARLVPILGDDNTATTSSSITPDNTIEETTTIEETSTVEEPLTVEETSTMEETLTVEDNSTMVGSSTMEESSTTESVTIPPTTTPYIPSSTEIYLLSANSLRIVSTNGTSLGGEGELGTSKAVACGLWKYSPFDLAYTYEIANAGHIYIDFVAQLKIEYTSENGSSETLFRYIGKRSRVESPVIAPLPEMSSPSPSSCTAVQETFHEPQVDIHTSFYESFSDACTCYSKTSKNDLTEKKYKWGGLHYGWFVEPPKTVPTQHPDEIFKNCLKFNFNFLTRCIIFTLDGCTIDPAIAQRITLEEVHIFALGAPQDSLGTSSDALPFGNWETVTSLGNCGNYVNDRAQTQRAEMFPVVAMEMCPVSPFGTFDDIGMPRRIKPQIMRLKMYPPFDIGKKEGFQPVIYAARLTNTELNFVDVPENSTVQYINFVLEAYAKIETSSNTSVPPSTSGRLQVISMKTPIMQVEYEDKEIDNKSVRTLAGIKPMLFLSHPLPYFQLDPNWHDKIHNEKQGHCSLSMVPKPAQPPTPIYAAEDACNCYTGPRFGKEEPITLNEFLEDVEKLPPLDPDDPKNITKDCFIFDHVEDSCVTKSLQGKRHRSVRVLVYFGLSCPGPAQLEIRDMIIQATNDKGFPIGSWEDIDYSTEASICENHFNKTVGEHKNETEWVIREVRPVSTYDCPNSQRSIRFPQQVSNLKAFYQENQPTLHFFNHNLTLYADQNSTATGFGFCVWWRYDIKQDTVVPGQNNKDQFYFDFQFSATAHVEYRPTHKRYVVAMRSGHKAGFNVKTCSVDTITEPVESNPINEIHMNKGYYSHVKLTTFSKCIPELDTIDTYETGICSCFVGIIGNSSFGDTHRIRIEDHPDKEGDPIRIRIDVLQQCLEMNIVNLASQPFGEYSIFVQYTLRGAELCRSFWFYEVVFEVLNDKNLPMGMWDLDFKRLPGSLCANPNEIGNAELMAHKCPRNPLLAEHYRSNPDEVYALHFQNRWKDSEFTNLCVVWRYPKDYAITFRDQPSKLPQNMQIYAQGQIFDKVSNMLLTSPVYSEFKIKYDKDGKFTQPAHKPSIQHISDFNTYLHLEFDKNNTCIPFPSPPDYISTMCKMFQFGGAEDIRIDLNNNDIEKNGFPFIKAKCFTFTAYPGNEPLSMHVTFTQESNEHLCVENRGIQFALTAYNELGFPIGRTSPEIGWTHYEHPRVPDTDRRYCQNEHIEVVHDTLLPIDNSECKFIPSPDVNEGTGPITDVTMKDLYMQDVTPNRLPDMIALGTDRRYPPKGICFHWVYDTQIEGQKTPSFIQFYIEFFVPKNPDNLKDGWKFILRSKKIEMNYKGGQELPNTVTKPAKNCHNESDPYNIFKPIPFPEDNWVKMHKYNIYPDKNNYRRCIEYKSKYGTCEVGVSSKETSIVINPVVILPGGLGTGEEDDLSSAYTNSTKIIYDGCIAGKVCFSPIQAKKGFSPNQPDCIIATDCEMVWAVGKQPISLRDAKLPDPGDDRVVVEVFAASTTWIAIGISKDDHMGDDYVLECVREPNGVNLYNSWNFVEERYDYHKHDNIRIVNSNNNLPDIAELVAKRAAGTSIYCMFYLKKTFTVTHPVLFLDYYYDLVSDSFCILNAYGETLKRSDGKVTGIGSHLRGKRKGHAPCKELASLNFRMMPTRRQVKILQNHGAILTVAYLGFLNTSIFVARYYQQTLTFVIFGYQLWIWIHGLCAACAAVVVLIGWFTVYPGLAGWQTPLTSPFHEYMGYLTILIALGNIVIGAFIRKTSAARSSNQILTTIHAVSGHFTSVFSHFIIMLTSRVEYAFIPCSTGLIAVIWVFIFFGFHVAMSFHRYWIEKFAGVKPIRLSLFTPLVLLTQKINGEEWLKTDKKANKTRIVILVAFCVFTWGFALTIAIQVVSSHHSCSLENNFRKLHPIE